jgi:O-antigen ligase
VVAQSRSAATGALLGVLAVLALTHRFRLLTLVGLAGTALIALTSAEMFLREAFLRGQSPGMFYSLSGRVNWWIPAWELFLEHLPLGLGGYAAGRFGVLSYLGATETSSLHNTWLEILVGVGVIGFVPFLATFIGTWLNLLRPLNTGSTPSIVTELRIESVGVFVLLCFRSIFTVEFIWHPPLVFFLVLGYAELLRRYRCDRIYGTQSTPAPWTPERPVGLPSWIPGPERTPGGPVPGRSVRPQTVARAATSAESSPGALRSSRTIGTTAAFR